MQQNRLTELTPKALFDASSGILLFGRMSERRPPYSSALCLLTSSIYEPKMIMSAAYINAYKFTVNKQKQL